MGTGIKCPFRYTIKTNSQSKKSGFSACTWQTSFLSILFRAELSKHESWLHRLTGTEAQLLSQVQGQGYQRVDGAGQGTIPQECNLCLPSISRGGKNAFRSGTGDCSIAHISLEILMWTSLDGRGSTCQLKVCSTLEQLDASDLEPCTVSWQNLRSELLGNSVNKIAFNQHNSKLAGSLSSALTHQVHFSSQTIST